VILGATAVRASRAPWTPGGRTIGVVGLPLLLSACQADVLNPAGPIGLAEKTILVDSIAIMLAIVLPTMAAIIGFAWWFRASNTRAVYRPYWTYSGRIELIVWGIPALVILLLGGVAWIGSHQLDPAEPLASDIPPLEVQAVSLDWKWLFLYPAQGIATVNQLVLPAGVPVRFSLTSASVMNAFFIPRLGSMIYTMNGMTTRLNLRADVSGDFQGRSSHFSGDGFSDMHFDVRAVPPGQFAAWIAVARGSGRTLDADSYPALARQTIAPAPITFRLLDPALFQKIVTRALPPGPGPDAGVSPRSER
jgi:cytochrome o ubiquinol oxidase subunit 2